MLHIIVEALKQACTVQVAYLKGVEFSYLISGVREGMPEKKSQSSDTN